MTLKLTKELADRMFNPSPDVVYTPHSLCSVVVGDRAEWTHPDDQYVIAFDRRTRQFTGYSYDWDEARQEWVETDPMTAEQIRECIERNRLILAR
jgi:hypothetical protein